MASAFIQYQNGNGFNIAEDFMQLFLYYANEEIKKPQYLFINKNLLIQDNESVIDGYQSNYLTLGWKNILTNTSEEQTMIEVLQNVKTTLQNQGAFISVAEMQAIPTEDEDFKLLYSRNPFPTSELIKIIDALIQMLQGTWTADNYDMDINYRY